MLEQISDKLGVESKPGRDFKKRVRILGVILVVVCGIVLLLVGSSLAYARYYRGMAYPGVIAGAYGLGGLTVGEIKNGIENFNNRYAREGIGLRVFDSQNKSDQIAFDTIFGSDNAFELIRLDADAIANKALAVGRNEPYPLRLVVPLFLLVKPRILDVPVIVNDQSFDDALRTKLTPFEEQPHNSGVTINSLNPVRATVIPEKSGQVFNYPEITKHIKNQVSSLNFGTVEVWSELFIPTVKVADVERIAPRLPIVLGQGDLDLSYLDPHTKTSRSWSIKPAVFAAWIEISRTSENNVVFSLKKEAVQKYLADEIRPFTDVAPQDARFVMEEGKVQEFEGSRNGFALDAEKTYTDLNNAFLARNYEAAEVPKTVEVSVATLFPKITTAAVNDLGITEVVGIGHSTFKDSHTNRIKNIANAVKRLNGILIKPGEEFSANQYAGPYTRENGFLPEMVIKGREIKPEIGGGMCQIGTTLFRMAMNSGLDITERRNHSLVVSYYADPVNGNPGTDATLYEPVLDLKFLNDTGNYLLLQTAIDYQHQLLTFTLWGKPDGRSGSYTHPLVSKWIPAGAPQMIPVTTLQPGEQKCQNAFRGAVASFTYTRTTPGGEKIDRVFESYYRPLPKICMVGTDPNSPPDEAAPAEGEIVPLEPVPVE